MKKKIIITATFIIMLLLTMFNNNNQTVLADEIEEQEQTIETDYKIEQVKFLAITLVAEGEHAEEAKITPCTCDINIDRVTKVVYMDEETEIAEDYIVYNEPVGDMLDITKRGHIFQAWTNKKGETITETTINTTRGKELRLQANWNVIVSNLKIDPNGGTWNDSTGEQTIPLEYSEEKNIEPPTRTGYTFREWEITGEDSEIDIDGTITMGIEDSVIRAVWDANEYNLTINPNNGYYDGYNYETEDIIKYDSTTYIEDPTREGYTFTGWSVSNGTLNGKNFIMNYPGDVTLTANWRINSYHYAVYHNQQSTDGSTFTPVAEDTITSNANYGQTITPEVKEYTGFTSPSEQSMIIQVDTNPPTRNIINYNYNRNRYILNINPNTGTWNGSTSTEQIMLYYEETYDVLNPTKVGYNFAGWNKTINTSTMSDTIFKMGLSETTLTAKWEAKNFLITYDVNGGNAISPNQKQITYDSPYGTLAIPTRTGYKFEGWYTSRTGGTKVTESTTHNTETNITLYAQWSNAAPVINSTKINYNNSGQTSDTDGHGLIVSNQETGTLTVSSSDVEDGTPTVTASCYSGNLCSYLTLTKSNNSSFTFKATKFGAGVIQVKARDVTGQETIAYQVITVYGQGSSVLTPANYTNTTFDSGWLTAPEGCYVSNFSFEVKFASGHNNSSNNDTMSVTAITTSGREVVLYTWTGNMKTTLHASDLVTFNTLGSEQVVKIKFYTYSPHSSCAASATITYSVNYEFDIDLIS